MNKIILQKLEKCYFNEPVLSSDDFGEQCIAYIVVKQTFSNGLIKIKQYKESLFMDVLSTFSFCGYSKEEVDCAIIDFIINFGKNITESEIKDKNPDYNWTLLFSQVNQPECSWGYMIGTHNNKKVVFVKDNSFPEFNIRIFNMDISELYSKKDVYKYVVDNFENNEKILEKDIVDYQEWNIIN